MTPPPSTSGLRPWLIVGAILLLVVAIGVGVWRFGRFGQAASAPNDSNGSSLDSASPDLTVLISGDTAGWIVPCGCASGQSGGLLRRGSFVAQERERNPTIVVDAGGAPGGAAPYDRLKFAAILKGELAMGIAAHNIGGPEIAVGLDLLRALQDELEVPFLSANLRSTDGKPVFEPCRIITANGRRVAFIGVLSQRYAAGSTYRIDEPREAILAALESHKGQFDWAIVLAYLPEPELRELAAALPEVHAVIGGPTGQSIAPMSVGPGLLASATNKGKFLVRLKIPKPSERISWSGDSIELTDKYSDDLAQADNLTEFRRDLGVRDLTAAETGLVSVYGANLPKDYQLAGSESCRECHEQDDSHWQKSTHSQAWETLVHRDSHTDSYCQQCHTTGFGLPGGFVSAKQSRNRQGVGCESCHGPSQSHVERPTTKTPFAAKDQCIRCHDHENSPQFDYVKYWEKIRHGKEMSKSP